MLQETGGLKLSENWSLPDCDKCQKLLTFFWNFYKKCTYIQRSKGKYLGIANDHPQVYRTWMALWLVLFFPEKWKNRHFCWEFFLNFSRKNQLFEKYVKEVSVAPPPPDLFEYERRDKSKWTCNVLCFQCHVIETNISLTTEKYFQAVKKNILHIFHDFFTKKLVENFHPECYLGGLSDLVNDQFFAFFSRFRIVSKFCFRISNIE